MAKDHIRVIIWGFGAMGSGMAEMLLGKSGVTIVGACDKHPQRVGRGVFALLGIDPAGRAEIPVSACIEEILDAPGFSGAEIALVATDSFTARTFDKLTLLAERGINVISTAEEMAYPEAAEPELAEELDRVARRHGVTILGTGINPGLIMDLLAVVLTAACRRVDAISARRVNSLSPFGPAVMEEQGVGLSPEEFTRRAADGSVAGHVGFRESIAMICDALGWRLDGPIAQSMQPIVSQVPRASRHAEVRPGMVAGCDMRAEASVGGVQRVRLEHPQQIEPQAEGTETGDYISISGDPEINLSIVPEVPGGVGTVAICVNMIPLVIAAAPGLKTMIDLPVPRAVTGDFREALDRAGGGAYRNG